MNEPFLLSNLIDLQEIDNKLFKLIESKSSSENVNKLKDLEIEFKDLTSNISEQINSLEKYFSIKENNEKVLEEDKIKDIMNQEKGETIKEIIQEINEEETEVIENVSSS